MRSEESLTNGVTEPHRWVTQLMRIRWKECGEKEEQDEHVHEELSQFGGVHSRDDLPLSCHAHSMLVDLSRNRVV
jgi:hypothetical protein